MWQRALNVTNGGGTPTKIWENASPSSSYSGGSITLTNLSSYTHILIMVKSRPTRTDTQGCLFTIDTTDGAISVLAVSINQIELRKFSISGATLTFASSGYGHNVGSTGVEGGANIAIPLAIYGVNLSLE